MTPEDLAAAAIDYAADRKDKPTVYYLIPFDKFDRPMNRFMMEMDTAMMMDFPVAYAVAVFLGDDADTIKKRLSLQGNPAMKDDWWVYPKTNEKVDFIDFCRSVGRFSKHFDKDGNPSPTLLTAKQDRLENWHLLQELAGIR